MSAPKDPPKAVDVFDLTPLQIEAIELEAGVPINLWGTTGSSIRIYRLVLAAGNGVPPEDYADMPARDLVKLASIGTDPDDDPNA